jgi:hypothetical protein
MPATEPGELAMIVAGIVGLFIAHQWRKPR